MATRRWWWIGTLALCGVTAIGCATGQNADPDADGLFDDVDKQPPEDTGKKGEDTGEGDDAVVGDDVGSELDSGVPADDGVIDTGTMDAGVIDTGTMDGGTMDAGTPDNGVVDSGVIDSGPRDTGVIDTGPRDTGPVDTGPVDTGPVDTGPVDTGVVDAGPTLVCMALAGNRTCHGNGTFAPCCIPILIATSCGCNIPIFGCLPCP